MMKLFKSKPAMAVYLACILLLHGNAILRNEDPISATQTDPISYDQKMEQEKDGVKAPATPKIIYYGGQGFLTKKPVDKPGSENTGPVKKKDSFNWSDWWEEEPAGDKNEKPAEESAAEPAAPSAVPPEEDAPAAAEEQASAPASEPAGDDFWGAEQKTQPADSQTAEPAPAGDDWW